MSGLDKRSFRKKSKGDFAAFILRDTRCRALGEMDPVLVTPVWNNSLTSKLSLPGGTHTLTTA